MPYLLDTCAISELGKPKPNLKVRDALLALPREELRLSTISLGEIEYGIQLRTDSKEKERLTSWLQMSILAVFGDRIIEVDAFVAMGWGSLLASLKRRGFKMQLQDSLIAATAIEYDCVVVTRNESDFVNSGVKISNPWK